MIAFCDREGVTVVFGSSNKISVRSYESIKLPPKSSEERERLISLLESIGKLDEVTDLDTHALTSVLKKKEWDKEELDRLCEFVTREVSHRLNVSKHEKS